MVSENITTKDVEVLVNSTSQDTFAQRANVANYDASIDAIANVTQFEPQFVDSGSTTHTDSTGVTTESYSLPASHDYNWIFDVTGTVDSGDPTVSVTAYVNGSQVASDSVDTGTGTLDFDASGGPNTSGNMQISLEFDTTGGSGHQYTYNWTQIIEIDQSKSSSVVVNSVTQS